MVGMPRKCPGDGLGASPRTSGTFPPDFCAIPHGLDRMSAGQTGHFHGTNGTRPRHGCDPKVDVPHLTSLIMFIGVFSS